MTGPSDPALRRSRVCYDHLAGELAVRFFSTAMSHGWFDAQHLPDESTSVRLLPIGREGLARLGIDADLTADPVANTRRPGCRACMDWSERRHHLAGTIGARLLTHCLQRGWAVRAPDSRAVVFRKRGERALFEAFAE